MLVCKRYIELNPVRAGMVEHPGEYRWSSYRVNAQGEMSQLLSPHPVYLSLGRDEAGHQANYRELFRHELEPGLVDAIRGATNGNFALGNERFCAQITAALERRSTPGLPGRPKRLAEPETLTLY